MKRICTAFGVMAVALAGLPAGAQLLSTTNLRYTLESAQAVRTSGVDGSVYYQNEIVSSGPQVSGLLATLDFLSAGRVGIDALIMSGYTIVFSSDVGFSVNGESFADEDLVRYDPVNKTFSLYLSGTSIGIPDTLDLDAATVEPDTGAIFLSVDGAFSVVDDDDILCYSNGAFTLSYEGQLDIGIPKRADIDGLYHDGTYIYFSLKTTEVIGVYTGRDEDVFIWNPDSGALVGVLHPPGLRHGADVRGIERIVDSDGDWLSDFEEWTGLDETGTTIPGGVAALGPNGFLSDGVLVDSDYDGYTDGEEGLAGTNPTNNQDYLRVTLITATNNGNVVGWPSAAGRNYDLQASTALSGFTNIVADDVASGGTYTRVTNADAGRATFYRVRLDPR